MSHNSVIDRFLVDVIDELGLPESILDVGAGYGYLSALLRIQFGFNGKIDAIEVYPEWAKRLNKTSLYDRVFEGDLLDILPQLELEKYGLLYFGDVLEHIEHKKSVQVIEELSRLETNVIITTPHSRKDKVKTRTKGVHYTGNDAMKHKSGFTKEFFEELGYNVILIPVHPIPRTIIPFYRLRAFLLGQGAVFTEIMAIKRK